MRHMKIEHLLNLKFLQVKKNGPEVIFTFEESISDIVFEISHQNQPLCVLEMFFELMWTF